MSFNISSRQPRAGTTVCVASMVLLLVFAAALTPALAGEARARGKKATITWIDAQGHQMQADARKIVYGYVVRRYLQVPRDGKNYKDETREEKGLPFAEDFINFTQIDRIEIDRRTDPDTRVSQLSVKMTLPGGKVRTGSAASLAGASHPISPYVAFTVDGVLQHIDLNPLATEAECAGKPRLVSIVFYL